MDVRVGFGYDIHPLKDEKGSSLTLGSVKINCDKRIVAVSDGDVILHSLSNALLSAIGRDDIGTYFKDSDPSNMGLDSKKILDFSLRFVKEEGYQISNIVVDVILEKPKLTAYKEEIKTILSLLLSLSKDRIAVHANSNEKKDSIGREEAIACYSSVTLIKE